MKIHVALLATSLALFLSSDAHCTESNQNKVDPNGGNVQSVGSLQIETRLKSKGIMFFIRGADGNMIKTPDITGNLTLKIENKPKEYKLKLQGLKKGGIGASVDLTKLKGKMLHMDVVLNGLTDQPIDFHTAGKIDEALSDAMLIRLQKTCPVTGKTLGSMGKPPKIIVSGKPLFVCCEPCSAKIKAKPEEYLAKYCGRAGKEIRPGVYEATLADAEAIAVQKTCPVMDEELGGMGLPQKVNIKGKSVFICCVGCAKKLRAEPDKYLAILAKKGISPPKFK